MISTSSILNAAAFCSLLVAVQAKESVNYSLWPQRPAQLETAREHVRAGRSEAAVELLQPFVTQKGIAGREARQITSAINVRRYLSREHPGLATYKVRRGENLTRIATATKCPADVLMLLNGMVEPSSLKVGQSLVYVPMRLRMEIRPLQRELSVWDGAVLVAAYNLELDASWPGKANEETEVTARHGYLGDVPLPKHDMRYLASERVLVLGNGWSIASGRRLRGNVLRMDSGDLNELTLLMGIGGRVSFVCDERAFRASQKSPRKD